MTDIITTKSVMNGEHKAKIRECYGIDVDNDLFNPMVDYIFKRTFTAEDIRSKVALIDLLNSVLKLEDKEIYKTCMCFADNRLCCYDVVSP
jgi:hypothetical protein